MAIYYGKFLEASNLVLEGRSYYEYFNSEEAIFKYKDLLRSLGISDILERIGKAEFNKNGRLIIDETTEKILYDPDKEFIKDINDEDDEDEDED